MKFRSDDQRKAVFANMFGGEKGKNTKVSQSLVKNFEVKNHSRQKNHHKHYVRRQRNKPEKYFYNHSPHQSPNYRHHIGLKESKNLNEKILKYIKEKPRTSEEIGKRFELNKRAVKYRVNLLIKGNLVDRIPFSHDSRLSYLQASGIESEIPKHPSGRKEKDWSKLKRDILNSCSLSHPRTPKQLKYEFNVTPGVVTKLMRELIEEEKIEKVPIDENGRELNKIYFGDKKQKGIGYLCKE